MEIKPCPFCGSIARLVSTGYGCSNEQCTAYHANIPLDDWNRRAEPAGPVLRELVEKWRDAENRNPGYDPEYTGYTCASELEAALANTEPSVPQPQSKTQHKRLVVQGAIEPSVPVSLLNKFRQQIDSNSYSRETILKKLGELITEAGGGSIGSSVLVSQLEEELQDAVVKVLSNNPEYRAPEMVGAVTALFETFITEARSHE